MDQATFVNASDDRSARSGKILLALLVTVLMMGCAPGTMTADDVSDDQQTDSETELAITTAMRGACPMLTDEVLDGFLLAVDGLKDGGLSEDDALTQWVDGCDSIPEDGNFQGDVEACRTCLPAIVEAVYAN